MSEVFIANREATTQPGIKSANGLQHSTDMTCS